jgi:superfamily II RNA helicase
VNDHRLSLIAYYLSPIAMSLSKLVRRPDVSVHPASVPPHPYSFPLDPFQGHAFHAIASGENVLVCAKTGSGKTLVGEYQIHCSLQRGKRVFYTTPIKSLSNQKYHDLKVQYPDASVGIMTGDIKFCPDAQVVIMTTEILRNLLYKKGTTTEHLGLTASLTMEDVDAVIFDECHYMNDPDRGKVWEEALMHLAPEVHLVLLSATLNQPERIASWLGEMKQVPIHLIETQYRVVPLTHYVLSRNGKMSMFMDEKEQYHERVYADWLRSQAQEEKEKRHFQQRVQEAKAQGTKGGVEGKVHTSHYIHRLNQAIQQLEEKELLPALLFVFSRKQCETYAHHIERSLIDTADSAAVRHIVSFHLHRYRAELEQTPQYHQLVDLLYRGIAFHHSGLLPILKEVVELLFARGYVKLLFCTETFAVGLNMPTKTVLFAGLKKYDDHVGGLRVVRSDEYFQMAGRAGRRGKDDRGVVVYLPEGEPLTTQEMYSVMKGSRPEVTSRMDFHVDFVLKTIHAHQTTSSSPTLDWMVPIRTTYWYQEYVRHQQELDQRISQYEQILGEYQKTEPYWSETMKCRELEQRIKQSVNAQRKELQRQLDTLKNRQLGPQWKKTAEEVQHYLAKQQLLEEIKKEREDWGTPLTRVEETIGFLRETGFIEEKEERLTLKGILATEVNEGHPILLTEFYLSGKWKTFTEVEWVILLSAFLEQREDEDGAEDIKPSGAMHAALAFLDETAQHLEEQESRWCGDRSLGWRCTTKWMAPMVAWYEGQNSATICQTYGFFEGNFYRSLLKLTNLVNEVISMATYCEHVDQVDQMTRISERLRRSQWTGESLYLRL